MKKYWVRFFYSIDYISTFLRIKYSHPHFHRSFILILLGKGGKKKDIEKCYPFASIIPRRIRELTSLTELQNLI